MCGRPLLVIAHPGHELLLLDWISETRPAVAVLTDGSGSEGTPRLEATRALLADLGAPTASVFGIAPDRRCYDAILAGDVDFFRGIAEALADEITHRRCDMVVSDAVEFREPMHDLCSALASLAAARAGSGAGRARRYEFAVETRIELAQATADWIVRRLSPDALERKRAAAFANPALRGNVDALLMAQPDVGQLECLVPRPPAASPMPIPTETPFYEAIGRARVAAGVFETAITYAKHVAPLVDALTHVLAPA